MTVEKSTFISFDEVRNGNVTLGNNAPTIIKGKLIFILKKGKPKAQIVLYVDGIKHNLLSVIQMCNQGLEATIISHDFVAKYLETEETIINVEFPPPWV